MVNAEGKINFDEIFASLFVINVSILMYKKPPEIQYNTMGIRMEIQRGNGGWESCSH